MHDNPILDLVEQMKNAPAATLAEIASLPGKLGLIKRSSQMDTDTLSHEMVLSEQEKELVTRSLQRSLWPDLLDGHPSQWASLLQQRASGMEKSLQTKGSAESAVKKKQSTRRKKDCSDVPYDQRLCGNGSYSTSTSTSTRTSTSTSTLDLHNSAFIRPLEGLLV